MTTLTTTPGETQVLLFDGSVGLQTISTVNGAQVSSTNPLPVSLGGGSVSIGTVAVSADAQANAVAAAVTEGAQTPLSTDLSRNLRIIEGSGAPVSGATMPAGGVGLTGWLSAIWSKLASTVTTTLGTAQRVVLVDPATGNGSLVQAFHNADNQVIGSTSYGLMTGGVDQLINGAGNLDRKRGVSGDGMAGTGLAAEVPMLWNGATYDRAPGSAAVGAKVQAGFVAATYTARSGLTAGIATAAGVSAGGTGYAVGNTITLTDGTVLTVSTVSSGVITGITLTTPATVTSQPTNPVAQSATSGTGTGATFTMTYGPVATQIMAANAARTRGELINPHATLDLWYSTDGSTPAANGAGSKRAAANGNGADWTAGGAPTAAIKVIGTAAFQPFTAAEA